MKILNENLRRKKRKIIIITIFFNFLIFIKSYFIKKNLIIGVIKGYNWKTIKPFFISLYKSNFRNYDCVIFVTNVSYRVINQLKSIGVIIKELPEKYKKIKINNIRYKLYEEYLQDKLYKYNMVLHVDIRDTFFQRDLFQLYEKSGSFIGLPLEEGKLSEKINSGWLKNQFGEKIYEELKNKQIICSGTIWGTVDKFYELVKNIWEEIQKKSTYKFSILDQSTTNYLIYHKKLFQDCIIISDVYSGPVMTVGLLKNRILSFDSEDNLLNIQNKNKAAVIHQYDRIPKLMQIIDTKFSSQNETNIKLNFNKC